MRILVAVGGGEAHLLEQLGDAGLDLARVVRQLPVRAERLGDDVARRASAD